jgi:hypothetical protein
VDPLDKKIAEALKLEAARDKVAEDAQRSTETKKFLREKRLQEYRDETIFPAFEGLNERLKGQEPPHYVVLDEVPGREFIAKIRGGTGEGKLGPVKLIMAEDDKAIAFLRVHGQVGKDDRWADEPQLDGDTYRLDAQQLTNRVVDLWIASHRVTRKGSGMSTF